jgi:hypothetical protein
VGRVVFFFLEVVMAKYLISESTFVTGMGHVSADAMHPQTIELPDDREPSSLLAAARRGRQDGASRTCIKRKKELAREGAPACVAPVTIVEAPPQKPATVDQPSMSEVAAGPKSAHHKK